MCLPLVLLQIAAQVVDAVSCHNWSTISSDVWSRIVLMFLAGRAWSLTPDSGRVSASIRDLLVSSSVVMLSILFLMIGKSQLDWIEVCSGIVSVDDKNFHSKIASYMYVIFKSLVLSVDIRLKILYYRLMPKSLRLLCLHKIEYQYLHILLVVNTESNFVQQNYIYYTFVHGSLRFICH